MRASRAQTDRTILLTAASLISSNAASLKDSHSVNGEWAEEEIDVRRRYIGERWIAQQLRTIARRRKKS